MIDPVSLGALAAGATAAGSALVFWWRSWRLRRLLEDAEAVRRQDAMDAQERAMWDRLRIEQAEEDERTRPQREEAARRAAEEKARQEAAREAAEYASNLQRVRAAYSDPVFATIAQNVRFTRERVLVGTRKSGERFLGVLQEESQVPADSVDIRPIRDINELMSALPGEWAMDEDMFDVRLANGEMLVQVPVVHIPLMEDVHEPVYQDVIHTVYVLLDVSPSMYPGQMPWRMPIWKGLTLKVLYDALASNAAFTLRPFSSKAHPAMRVINEAQAIRVAMNVLTMPPGDGTDIRKALEAALSDFKSMKYDTADILIITDGEDEAELAKHLRGPLDARRIKLHAVMLGINNKALRECCDSYQVVEEADPGVTVHPVVNRAPPPIT